jgi:hypothetical protein
MILDGILLTIAWSLAIHLLVSNEPTETKRTMTMTTIDNTDTVSANLDQTPNIAPPLFVDISPTPAPARKRNKKVKTVKAKAKTVKTKARIVKGKNKKTKTVKKVVKVKSVKDNAEPTTGQSAPPREIPWADLSKRERRLLTFIDGGIDIRPLVLIKEMVQVFIGSAETKARANSWVRNQLRDLVVGGWVVKVDRGVYQIDPNARKRLRHALAAEAVEVPVTDTASPSPAVEIVETPEVVSAEVKAAE